MQANADSKEMTSAVLEIRDDDPESIAAQIERQPSEQVIVSLAKTPRISSDLVNELLRAQLRLRMGGRKLELIDVQPEVAQTFRMLRFERTISFREAPPCLEDGQQRSFVEHPPVATEGPLEYFMRRFFVGRLRRQRTRVVATGFGMPRISSSSESS